MSLELREATKSIIEELNRSLTAIDYSQVDKLVEDINNADNIFCIAAGRSKLVLSAFCMRLNHLGYSAYMIGGLPCPPATSKDLVIAASGSGTTTSVISILSKAKEIGTRIDAFTADENTALSTLASNIIEVKAPSTLNDISDNKSSQLMRTLFEQTVFILTEAIVQKLSSSMCIEEIVSRHTNLE